MFTFCMQPNTCRSWRQAEVKAIRVCGHGRDQEVELMVRAAASRGTVEELAVGGRGSKRRRREKPTVALGVRLVVMLASYGGADGGKTGDEGGDGWRPNNGSWSLFSDLCNWTPNWPLNFQFLQFHPWFLSIKPLKSGAFCRLVLSCQFLQFSP